VAIDGLALSANRSINAQKIACKLMGRFRAAFSLDSAIPSTARTIFNVSTLHAYKEDHNGQAFLGQFT
jgi:hypothetical protein